MITVLEVLQSTTAYFKKHKIESARLNAEHLIAHVLEQERIGLYLEFERQLTEAELKPIRELVKRRVSGEPLQHLLGTIEFCGMLFRCDKRGMVPRPETEELVELLKCEIENPNSQILDVGTGSGVIALSLAANFPKAHIAAVDISDEALALARENASQLNLTDRIHFTKSNLLDSVDGSFDLIVANLPYIRIADRHTLSAEVLHDPDIALFSGVRGDELLREIIDQSPAHLRSGGMLALEIGIGQGERLFSALTEKNYHDIQTKNDYSGVTRFLFARYG